jgi:holin-like protein
LLFLSLLIFYRKKDASKQQHEDALTASATAILSRLSLLFIPAGVGLIVHINRLESQWLPIVLSIVLGSIITMTVTAWVMLLMNRLLKIEGSDSND